MRTLLHPMILLFVVPGLLLAQPAPEAEALHLAAMEGDLAKVRSLVAAGVAVDVRDPEQRTPLMWAGFNGHSEVVVDLLESGADIQALDANGRTVLLYTSSGPFAETVGILVEKGAEVNTQGTAEGFTALMTAAAEGQLEVVAILLSSGADPGLEDADGDTAESFAEQNGHHRVVELLRGPPSPEEQP